MSDFIKNRLKGFWGLNANKYVLPETANVGDAVVFNGTDWEAGVANGGSNFLNTTYWSSREDSISTAFSKSFLSGANSANNKSFNYQVRPVRAF
jgi:hypothetical protein